jgi:hypothetical protein
MRFTTKICWLSLLFCHLYSPDIQGQAITRDSSSVADGYADALIFYHAYLTPETRLYRGPEYLTYDRLLRDGHPYYGENSKRSGTVYYDGIFFDHVMLRYDIVSDLVILNDPYNVFRIAMISELLDSFTIEDHFFIHLSDSLNPNQPRNGFYERLYNGRIVLLKREKKIVQEDLYSSDHVERFIDHTDSSYYLRMGKVYHTVNNNKSLFYTLKDRKREVRKFIRTNHLSMRRDRENTLIKVTAWYDNPAH